MFFSTRFLRSFRTGLVPVVCLATLLLLVKGEEWSTPDQREEFESIPNDWFFAQRAYPYGRIDQQAYREALQYRQARSAVAMRSPAEPWQPAGPTNIGGRITDLEMPGSSTRIIYAGTASGGIFYSENQGASWIPIFDQAAGLSIGDMALAPSDERILYVGTGEANAGGGSMTYDGTGMYRSDDGGRTWRSLGLDQTGSIGRVAVHPTRPNTAYVAAMGRLFADNSERGLFRTTDGGASWKNILYRNDSTGVIDVALDPQNPDRLYAATWERVRRPHRRSYGGASSGIFRSTDGGDTWTELKNGLPASPGQKGRIALAVAPSQPRTVYASYADADGNLEGIFRSDDYGDTWQRLSQAGIETVNFMWWFGRLFVDPANPRRIFFPSLDLYESTDGGATWGQVFVNTHVDQHALIIHPSDPRLLVLGNDGGVFISKDSGRTMAQAPGLPITQFYTCAVDFLQPDRLYGGAQDNGNIRMTDGRSDNWGIYVFGDGFVNLIDPSDNRYLYAATQYGNFYRSTDGGQSFRNALTGIPATDRKNWKTPIVLDPSAPSRLYYGTQRLYRSSNRAQSWSAVSPDLSRGAGGGNLVYGTLTSISVSPVDPRIIFVGTDDGQVQVTRDEGNRWTLIADGLPNRWVTSVLADPRTAETAYVTLSGYRFGEQMGHVYRTTNSGADWEDVSGNLPDVPVNDILVHPGRPEWYVATDIGVFFSTDDGRHWEVLGAGLPNVVVTDLALHEPSDKLVAATFGRSIYTLDLGGVTSAGRPDAPADQLTVFPSPFRQTASIHLELASGGYRRIVLQDVQGRLVRNVFTGVLPLGRHDFTLQGNTLPAGTYVCSLWDVNRQVLANRWIIKGE